MNNDREETAYPLDQLYLYLTEGCNLRCRHCWIAPEYQDTGQSYGVLSLCLIKSIVEQAKPLGLSGIKLTGGEPLLHPDIIEILEYVTSADINLSMETNGVLCTPEIARKIAECKNRQVSVSLDGADREIHEWVRRVPGSFDAALEGIHNLVSAGIKPQIIMCIMSRNKDQIEPLVRLAEEVGAESVKFNLTQPMARGEKLHQNRDILPIKKLVELGAWVENSLSRSTGLNMIFDHPAAFRPLSRIFGNGGTGCSACGILGILGVLSDGSYALCGIGENAPEMIFGHAASDRLEQVWKTTGILNELRKGLTHRLEGICGNCLMKGLCMGACIAQNYYQSKSLWAPFWYCEKALETGLFPEGRKCPTT